MLMLGLQSIAYHAVTTMNRRAFFSFLPAAPLGALMAAKAMAKTLPMWSISKPATFTVYDKGDGEWYKEIVSKHQVINFV